MQIQLDNGNHAVQIEACRENTVQINKKSYQLPLVVSPENILEKPTETQFLELSVKTLDTIFNKNPEVVIVGTGEVSQFLPHAIEEYCQHRQFTIDTMSTDAACRTFMLLASEGRNVIALLF